MAFAKLKAHLRRIGARNIDDLWSAIGNIYDLYDPDECWNYIELAPVWTGQSGIAWEAWGYP
jgi:hypothetical protein